ncbi:MAG: hypothetical protein WA941_01290 [Nitrososphaeraceae archaeon]
MNETKFRILNVLSKGFGKHISIKELTDRIKEFYGTAYYKNIYDEIKSLTREEILQIEKIGNSSIIQLNFANYLLLDILSEMELKKKYDLLKKRPEMLMIFQEFDTYLRKIPLISSICISSPEKNIRLNRIEFLALLKNSSEALIIQYKNELYRVIDSLQKKYTLKIDCMILTNNEFLDLLQLKERNPLAEMLSDKIAFINPQGFWLDIKEAHKKEIHIILQPVETNPARITENDLIYNLARFGYKEFGSKITSGQSICIEYIIAAVFMSREARRNEAVPVIMEKNNLNYNVLTFLSQKYGFSDRLLGMLKVLDKIKSSDIIKENILALENRHVKEIKADKKGIQDKMKLYNVT